MREHAIHFRSAEEEEQNVLDEMHRNQSASNAARKMMQELQRHAFLQGNKEPQLVWSNHSVFPLWKTL